MYDESGFKQGNIVWGRMLTKLMKHGDCLEGSDARNKQSIGSVLLS